MVQFWSWIGWYPFLFYGSTWVGEIYVRHEAPDTAGDALTEVGRAGATSYIIFSIVTFASAIVLPWLVQSPDDENEREAYASRPLDSLQSRLTPAPKNKPTLLTTWMLANIVFACAMVFAPLVRSVAFASLLIAISGVSWAVAGWAPGTFLGVEVNKMSSSIPLSYPQNGSYRRVSGDDMEMHTPPSSHSSPPSTPRTLHLRHSSTASSVNTNSTGELSGVYFGILNIYTTLPQFVGTAISWVVFSIFEPGKSPELATHADPSEHHSTEGVSGIAICLFIGAICAVIAAWATRRLKVAV
jgi:solute carrier family 45, member 1/2/4